MSFQEFEWIFLVVNIGLWHEYMAELPDNSCSVKYLQNSGNPAMYSQTFLDPLVGELMQKMLVSLGGYSITTWTRWRGEVVIKCLFLSTLKVQKLSTQGRGGVKKLQKMPKFYARSCWMTPSVLPRYRSRSLGCTTMGFLHQFTDQGVEKGLWNHWSCQIVLVRKFSVIKTSQIS